MADLTRRRETLKRSAIVLAIICAAAAIYLLLPMGGATASRQAELSRLQEQYRTKHKQVQPLVGIDAKIVNASHQIKQFYDTRLPERYSGISEQIGKLAKDNGVALSGVKYNSDTADIPNLEQVLVETQIAGSYENEAKFVNAVERSKMFFLIDSIELTEQEGGQVRLKVVMETYLRNSGPPLVTDQRTGD